MKNKFIIFTKEELKKLNLKKINNYYIIHRKQLNKRVNKKCSYKELH